MKIDPARMKEYQRFIAQMHQDLGIPADYAQQRGLSIQYEALPKELIAIENDIYNRAQQLSHRAADQWYEMKKAAAKDNIELLVISAFRSVEYQKNIFENKLAKNQAIATILQVNAAPGYSEHHTGDTLDITTPFAAPLNEAFERTPAFVWLTANAAQFGFYMSYPRNNQYQVIYEPWHWTLIINQAK